MKRALPALSTDCQCSPQCVSHLIRDLCDQAAVGPHQWPPAKRLAGELRRRQRNGRRHFLEAYAEEDPGDGSLIRAALNDIARAQNMSLLARDVGMSREGLYKALSEKGTPSFATVMRITRALGMQLRIMGVREIARGLHNLQRPSQNCHRKDLGTSGGWAHMKRELIYLFMWGYQRHFRSFVEIRMDSVMKELGVSDVESACLLVGTKIPGHENQNDVCVEPENGKWSIDLFEGLLNDVEMEIHNHPMRDVIYGDEPSMRDKPENIRRDSVRKAVQKTLEAYDSEYGVCSFAGPPAPVEDHYVVPVLQLPDELFERVLTLRRPASDDGHVAGYASLVHATVSAVLDEAYDELLRPDPGRYPGTRWRSSEEIIRRAASSFMYAPGVAIGDKNYFMSDLFERFNSISSLMYEGTKGTGKLLLARPDGEAVDMLLKFSRPIPFRESRWSRKVLQMASSEAALIADCEKIFGLGKIAAGVDPLMSQNVFEIEFLDLYHWRLLCGGKVMLVSKYGTPSLPQEEFPRHRLLDTYQRLFPDVSEEDVARFVTLFEAAVDQQHGSMLVVAKDAEAEVGRLQGQGTRIEPTKLSSDLYRKVSGIDGAIIIDPHCVCHAIGVILDGSARPECTPSRGSRYNSGLRYVSATDARRLVVVVSDDRTVDVIPVLPLRIKRLDVEKAIAELEAATSDNYHSAINWLGGHRFYLNQGQCDRINAALEKIQNEPMEVGEMRRQWDKFSPHPALDESYFESEDTVSASS